MRASLHITMRREPVQGLTLLEGCPGREQPGHLALQEKAIADKFFVLCSGQVFGSDFRCLQLLVNGDLGWVSVELQQRELLCSELRASLTKAEVCVGLSSVRLST